MTEPSDAVNAGMAVQTEGRRLALSASRRPSVRSLVVIYSLDARYKKRTHQDNQLGDTQKK